MQENTCKACMIDCGRVFYNGSFDLFIVFSSKTKCFTFLGYPINFRASLQPEREKNVFFYEKFSSYPLTYTKRILNRYIPKMLDLRTFSNMFIVPKCGSTKFSIFDKIFRKFWKKIATCYLQKTFIYYHQKHFIKFSVRKAAIFQKQWT